MAAHNITTSRSVLTSGSLLMSLGVASAPGVSFLLAKREQLR